MMALARNALASTVLGLAFLAFLPARVAWSQDEEQEATAESGDGGEGGEAEEEDEKENEVFALVGGDVYTGTGGVLRDVTILSKNGKIREIGHDVYIPEDAKTLDVRGYRVYPGLVALNASSSISGGLFSTEDPIANEEHVELDPHLGLDDAEGETWERLFGTPAADGADSYDAPDAQAGGMQKAAIEDSFDPFSQYLVLALATGITTAEQSDAAVKLRRGKIDGILMKEKNLAPMAWSESNPSTIRSTREKFAAAAKYLRKYQEWDALDASAKKETKEPSRKGVDTNTLRVLRGELLARFNANDREDLLGIARFAQEYHFRPVISGCREGWTVADELGRAGAYAIVTPRDRSAKDERLVRPGGTSIENAAILHRSGVQIAIEPGSTAFNLGGITGRDLMHLPVEAAFGVRGGLPEGAALESITIVPARILGVDHRVGSIEVGKDMDVIVTDGDILHYQTFVQYAVVAGELVYDKQEEIFFAHIRPRPEVPKAEPAEEEAVEKEEAADEEEVEQADDGAGEDSVDDDDGKGEDEDGN